MTAHDDAPAAPAPEDAPVEEDATAEVMSLLSEGVPLALLADLANPHGPSSPDILEDEGLPDVAWWAEGAADDPGAEAVAEQAGDGPEEPWVEPVEEPEDGVAGGASTAG